MTDKGKSIYFPFEVPHKRHISGVNRFLQKKYFEDPVELDTHWNIKVVTGEEKEEDDENEVKGNGQLQSIEEDKKTFLQDLSKLIDSDVYNMPKISTMERRKTASMGIMNKTIKRVT